MHRCVLALAVILTATAAQAENWPQWRGPQGTGIADASNLPVEWSREKNITWRTALPTEANSSPVVWEDRVFITAPYDGGKQRAVLCVDRANGKILWQREIEYEGEEPTHRDNPPCSQSPATDGQIVVAWHGSAGVVAYDFAGEKLWQRDLGAFEHLWGNASSPVIQGDYVYLHCGPGVSSFLIALDKQTGETVWQRDLPASEKVKDWKGSWSTPVFYTAADGETRIMLSTPQLLRSIHPATGEDVWTSAGLSDLVYTSPLVGKDVVVAMSGYRGPAIAVRLGGEGDVTQSHRLWQHTKRNPQRVGSGVIVGNHIYILNEPGVAACYDLQTGETVWEERVGSKSWGSMVYGDGKLYVTDMKGTTHVLAASPESKELAHNSLGEVSRSSPAISDGQIFIRTYEALYCIGERQ